MSSTKSCGGHRPSSTWPPGTPPKGPASAWDHRWRSRWHFAASLGGGWAVPDGGRTSTTPSRWPETATRQRSALSSPGRTVAIAYGVLRADDSALLAIEEAVQTAQRASSDIALIFAEYALGAALLYREAAADRRPRAGADGAGPRVAARADALPGPAHRVVGLPGEGQARRRRSCHSGDAQSRRRAAPGRTAGVWQFWAPAFWWRRCWSVAPMATWPKPKR